MSGFRRVFSAIVAMSLAAGVLPRACEGREVTFAAMVYRHGDRTPIAFFPSDPDNAMSTWDPPGSGLLTYTGTRLRRALRRRRAPLTRGDETTGMMQHYELGKQLRERWITNGNLVSASYDRREVSVRSTDVDRTLMSAQSQLAGFYGGGGHPAWPLAWRPVPVHTVSLEDEWLMRPYSEGVCPEYGVLHDEWTASDEYRAKAAEHKELFAALTEATGMEVTMGNVFVVNDATVCQRAHNRTVLPAVRPHLPEMNDLTVWLAQNTFAGPRRSITGGFLAQRIVELLDAKAQDPPQEFATGNKVAFFSAHDTTLLALQSALGVHIAGNPPYASHFIFELYDDGTVEMEFNGEAVTLDGCAARCPVDQLTALLRPVFPGEEEVACGQTRSSGDDKGKSLSALSVFVLFALVVGVVGGLGYVLVRVYRRSRDEARGGGPEFRSMDDMLPSAGVGDEEL